jgi:hypothetical protein
MPTRRRIHHRPRKDLAKGTSRRAYGVFGASRRAQLNEELGFFPASVDPESAARHRREAAQSDADYAAYLLEYGPNGHKRNRWRHLTEKKRQMEVEAAGRATVADLYE